jgi:hypothetical protein
MKERDKMKEEILLDSSVKNMKKLIEESSKGSLFDHEKMMKGIHNETIAEYTKNGEIYEKLISENRFYQLFQSLCSFNFAHLPSILYQLKIPIKYYLDIIDIFSFSVEVHEGIKGEKVDRDNLFFHIDEKSKELYKNLIVDERLFNLKIVDEKMSDGFLDLNNKVSALIINGQLIDLRSNIRRRNDSVLNKVLNIRCLIKSKDEVSLDKKDDFLSKETPTESLFIKSYLPSVLTHILNEIKETSDDQDYYYKIISEIISILKNSEIPSNYSLVFVIGAHVSTKKIIESKTQLLNIAHIIYFEDIQQYFSQISAYSRGDLCFHLGYISKEYNLIKDKKEDKK